MSSSCRTDSVEENFVRETKDVIEKQAVYAVQEYNKEKKSNLEFKRVVSSRQQEIPRILNITLEAKLGKDIKIYEAKLVKRGATFKLEAFKPVGEGSSGSGSLPGK
ncbi:Cysteine proteinase inhibitor [Quillaja saponaria]|uniref:Cysteine proteinase inhibitor n=1 Tax=Quillaja saponaria TaxID=32244 RepID=A0AAD7PQY9_QUISA|nr:Cysteine proteinase inhibitor [Quillaja saponaria]